MEPVLLPVSRAVLDPEAIRPALARRWKAVAVTSTNAVRALAGLPGAVEAFALLTFFVVGERTAAEAISAGFPKVRTGTGTGRELAGLVATEFEDGKASGPLLYCAGEPRSPDFEQGMTAARIPYEAVVCYRMEKVVYTDEEFARVIPSGGVDVVLLYSRESAERFFRLLSRYRAASVFAVRVILCLSAQVAEAVPEPFRPMVEVAAKPDEKALLEILATVQT
jgi:uroporphyrinogen-III synthase